MQMSSLGTPNFEANYNTLSRTLLRSVSSLLTKTPYIASSRAHQSKIPNSSRLVALNVEKLSMVSRKYIARVMVPDRSFLSPHFEVTLSFLFLMRFLRL